ncbi:MAG: ATP-binding protein [Candidatus Riflebacteria bacterium]|nr:ATP-binding protein [Candidatus Riflebacteria bacterium]
MFERPLGRILEQRWREPRRFLLLLTGPRQTGKTTLVRQVLARFRGPSRYAAADAAQIQGSSWIAGQWELARLGLRQAPARQKRYGGLLVLDEIQKIPGWSETVKRLWDEDTRHGFPLRVVLLGSAPLLLQRGTAESLAGRFERLTLGHWSFPEMRQAFGWDVPTFLFFGGYPGAATLIGDEPRWAAYIRDSLIEATLARDILEMTRVDKPALMRNLFLLGCQMAGQVVSYQKMVGQLQDVGNTTTLAHYLDLLGNAGLLVGLEKWSGQALRRRASSPKLLPLNTALVSALSGHSAAAARADHAWWGRLVETAVGAHLWSEATALGATLTWWREGPQEVDFVVSRGRRLLAFEVKTGTTRTSLPGMTRFLTANPRATPLLIGPDGLPLETFLTTPLETLLADT